MKELRALWNLIVIVRRDQIEEPFKRLFPKRNLTLYIQNYEISLFSTLDC